MKNVNNSFMKDWDPTAESRKTDHIDLAFKAQVEASQLDNRFQYEPMLSPHPLQDSLQPISFGAKTLKLPIWVSSMTGGTEMARRINHNLAKVCAEFGMGMGLGSCRSLLSSDHMLPDFDVRSIIGNDLPLYANLGIAQLEHLVESEAYSLLQDLIKKLKADGLIIHVNPMQEWMQPEGDRFLKAPIDTIKNILDKVDFPIIVKEVGQGFGPNSMKALLELPLEAVEFASSGGTNFALLELMRSDIQKHQCFEPLTRIGHSAEEMVDFANKCFAYGNIKTKQLIISGGVKNFLDGYYLMKKSNLPAIYGQASTFLEYARGEYETLRQYVLMQKKGLELANKYLVIKE
jgi:isopentenyl-diphosphate Delta-isomerase